jgi:hypothetical protein
VITPPGAYRVERRDQFVASHDEQPVTIPREVLPVEERMRRIAAALLADRHVTTGLEAYLAAARIIAAADRIAELESAQRRRPEPA